MEKSVYLGLIIATCRKLAKSLGIHLFLESSRRLIFLPLKSNMQHLVSEQKQHAALGFRQPSENL